MADSKQRVEISKQDVVDHQLWTRSKWAKRMGRSSDSQSEGRRIEHTGVTIVGSNDLSYCSDVSDLSLTESYIDRFRATNSFLNNSDFSKSQFSRSDFSRASLGGSKLNEALLFETDFIGSDLIWDGDGVDFSNANFVFCDLSGATYRYKGSVPNIKGASFNHSTRLPCGIQFGVMLVDLLPRYLKADGNLTPLSRFWEMLGSKISANDSEEACWWTWVDFVDEHDEENSSRLNLEESTKDLLENIIESYPIAPEHIMAFRDFLWLADGGIFGPIEDLVAKTRTIRYSIPL